MNWDKSKTIIIWLLIALNGYLFLVNNVFKTSYDIKGEQEKAIIELLNKNGIGVYDEINIEFKPLAHLNIQASENDVNEESYLETFFDNPNIIRENNQIIATEDSKTIIFENGFISFYINDEEDYYDINGDLEEFIKNLDPAYQNFKLDKRFVEQDHVVYEFREVYKDKVIYTNYLSVIVEDNKISFIQGFYGKPIGVGGKAREIASIDMILYTFMEEAKEIYNERNIFITGVDLVYYQEEYSSYDVVESVTKAIPCYRIYSEGEKVPFIISAYENKVIN